jgi:FlaA1/EpsC-like NDP-sugar epimerase
MLHEEDTFQCNKLPLIVVQNYEIFLPAALGLIWVRILTKSFSKGMTMKRIIITGANEGIGYYLVCQALADGQRVAVLDIQTENLTALQQTYPQALLVFTADVRDAERVSACVAQAAAAWGGLDYAIHNAALC